MTYRTYLNTMKGLYFYFSIVISTNSLAQTSIYHPFPDSNVVWNVEVSSQCSVGFADHYWHSYILDGDTIIGLYNYRKVYDAWIIEHWVCWGMNFSYPGEYVGAIRQDTALRTVYFFELGSASENLLYDFDLHVGDTLRGYNSFGCAEDSIISEEDSVYIDGNYRKRWKLDFWYGPNYIIEGVGFTGGPFSPICGWFEGGSTLICCTQNNVILFQDSMYTTTPGLCEVINSIPILENKQEVRLFPNPFSNEATLETKNFPATLFILNNMGQLVKQQQINSSSTPITSEFLRSGVYTFCIQSSHADPLYMKVLVAK